MGEAFGHRLPRPPRRAIGSCHVWIASRRTTMAARDLPGESGRPTPDEPGCRMVRVRSHVCWPVSGSRPPAGEPCHRSVSRSRAWTIGDRSWTGGGHVHGRLPMSNLVGHRSSVDDESRSARPRAEVSRARPGDAAPARRRTAAGNQSAQSRSEPRPASARSADTGSVRRGLLGNLPIIVGVLAMAVYFIWVCLQMSIHAPGGRGLLIAVFGPAAAGIVAVVLGLLLGR